MAEDDDDLIPESGAVFTFGRSRFADNYANKFWIKNDPVFHVACGDEHSAVLTERGRVYVFGSNDWGQLGLGHTKPLTKPSFVKLLKPEKIILLACGRSHTLVYSESKKLLSFGANGDGQLGHGNKQNEHVPKEISDLSGFTLKSISCGAYHSAALTAGGEVYVWGVNSDGQLGLGETEECSVPTKLKLQHVVSSLSCGYYHTAFISTTGLLFTFGEDENGKLGLTESQCDDTTIPQPVAKLDGDKYYRVACGARHTVAITEKGCCYSWGDGTNGQLGHGTKLLDAALPTRVDLLSSFKIIYVSCGDSHTAVFSDSGKIFSFGDGRHGKLGQGDECFSNLFRPTIISRFNDFHVNFVDCGGCHMLVGATRKLEQNIDETDDIPEEVDMLNSSIRSNQSIADANMTMKPGSMTFPIVTKRDKRRHKEEDNNPLNTSLNASLNSSLNMAQLSRTMPEPPGVLDRSKLPKIHGVSQPNINNHEKNNLDIIKENSHGGLSKSTDGDVEMKQNTRLVAAITFSRDNNKTDDKVLQEKTSNKIVRKGEESDLSDDALSDIVKNKEKKKSGKKIVEDEDDKDSASGLRRKPLKKLQKIEIDKEEEDEDEDSDEYIDEVRKRKEKKKVNENKKLGRNDSEEDDDDDYNKGKKRIRKNKKKLDETEATHSRALPSIGTQRKNKRKESEDDEEVKENIDEDDEDDDEDDDDKEETIKPSSRKSKNVTNQSTPLKETKVKKSERKSKKLMDLEDKEDEEEEVKDMVEDESGVESGVESEEEEEESEEEDSPIIAKKGIKGISKEGSIKESPKKNNASKKEVKQVLKKVNKKDVERKSLQNKSPEKKNAKGKVKSAKQEKEDDENEEEEDDDEDEEEDEEEEEEEEEEVEEDETDEEDGGKDEVDTSKKTSNKKGKKSSKTKEKINDSDTKETVVEVEPSEEANNRSGFLNFFRRSKKPQNSVPADSKSPERTESPPTNKNQSKTCAIL